MTSRADFKREEMRAYQLGEAWEGTKDLMANVAVYSVKAGTEAVRLTAYGPVRVKAGNRHPHRRNSPEAQAGCVKFLLTRR